MVLVDASVWITVYRMADSLLGRRLWQLAARDEAAVCGQVWVEFLGGFRSASRRERFAERLGSFRWLETTRECYALAAEWCAGAAKIGAGDAVIASTAYLNAATLLTSDREFQALAPFGLELELVD